MYTYSIQSEHMHNIYKYFILASLLSFYLFAYMNFSIKSSRFTNYSNKKFSMNLHESNMIFNIGRIEIAIAFFVYTFNESCVIPCDTILESSSNIRKIERRHQCFITLSMLSNN